MLTDVPDDYWLHKYPFLPASSLFFVDPSSHCLRLRRSGEFPQWKRFSSKRYRRLRAPHSIHLFPPITSSSLHAFWSVTFHFPARTVWYQVLHRKIPTSSFLSNIQLTSSNICRLCNAVIDTLDHSIVLCPLKLPTWTSLLQTAFPDFPFSPDAILQLLLYLQLPTDIHRVDIPQLFTIAGTILWRIWVHYWQYIMQKIPYVPQIVIKSIEIHLSLITGSSSFTE
ncbi:MAG: hypothetical protein EXX96DRAFT_542544 [Benjaminiella poitrasii]|nr:MAG: hypothetical protein EXX96DRAFT_542544 [Benjaminiella poitrasii]